MWIVVSLVTAGALGAALVVYVTTRDDGASRPASDASASRFSSNASPQSVTPTQPAEAERDLTDLAACSASSELSPQGGNSYVASNLMDGRLTTCWAEGVPGGYGHGETLTFEFDQPVTLTEIRLVPGYAKVDDGWSRWRSNGRLKRIELHLGEGHTEMVRLADRRGWQGVRVEAAPTELIQIVVLATYPAGGPHAATDLCVSEIEFRGWPESELE